MMASMAGINSCPNAVNEYSTDGGEVGMTARVTNPFSSRLRNRALNILAVILVMSLRSSPKRRGPARKNHNTLGVHAPPRNAMHPDIGHGSGGERFFLTFKAMGFDSGF